MAGVEIDIDSDEYQAWYISFSKFLPQAISEAHTRSVKASQNILRNQIGPNAKSRVGTTQVSDLETLRLRL